MAPDACTATPRAPHVLQHGQDSWRVPPLLPDVMLHDWNSCKAPQQLTHGWPHASNACAATPRASTCEAACTASMHGDTSSVYRHSAYWAGQDCHVHPAKKQSTNWAATLGITRDVKQVYPSRLVPYRGSGCLTSLREVASALCFINSYCARDDDLALSWSLQLHSGFATTLWDVALASFALHGFDARCTHLAARGRSGSRKLSTGCWAQSGYATLLREVAPVQIGFSLQWVALHSTHLERAHQNFALIPISPR
ncbi:hypothetical protein F2Q69_00036230 [Brassica cretica]|uniref:Uncharacterized protein n=1 Tax=Brassica cretica TaxID=69181 RepID=A0A8S9SBJ6_BRACR|nr:hypothetical protein F2Q69_00036230 [Brassica cretica]